MFDKDGRLERLIGSSSLNGFYPIWKNKKILRRQRNANLCQLKWNTFGNGGQDESTETI